MFPELRYLLLFLIQRTNILFSGLGLPVGEAVLQLDLAAIRHLDLFQAPAARESLSSEPPEQRGHVGGPEPAVLEGPDSPAPEALEALVQRNVLQLSATREGALSYGP